MTAMWQFFCVWCECCNASFSYIMASRVNEVDGLQLELERKKWIKEKKKKEGEKHLNTWKQC